MFMSEFLDHHEEVDFGEQFSILNQNSHIVGDVTDQILQLNFKLVSLHHHLGVLSVILKFLKCFSFDLLGFLDELLQNFVVGNCTLLCYLFVLLYALLFCINPHPFYLLLKAVRAPHI